MPDTCGPKVLQTVFVHIEKVRITCPFCGASTTRVFQKLNPNEGFVPALVTCECGRYSYGHCTR